MNTSNWLHVLPINDLKPHKEQGFDCECEPKIDWDNELIIHNSYDGREMVEQAEAILKANSLNLN